MPRKSTLCDHKNTLLLRKDSLEKPLLQAVLQTHQRTEVAATIQQKLGKPGPWEQN